MEAVSFEEDVDTSPGPLTVGDRVAIERRIDRFEARVNQHMEDRDKSAAEFFSTRMVPLETTVHRKVRLMWFVAGMSFAGLLVSIAALSVALSISMAR